MKNRIIPIHYMWPETELELLKNFLDTHQDDLDKRLLDLAFGEAEDDKGSYASWWKAWIGLKRRSVNLPRTVFATWLPIRSIVAFDPWLLDECSELAVARQHWWFSGEGLEKFRRYFKSEAHTLLEVFRPMQGWSRNHEIISTYCRSWALIMELERLKLLRRSRKFSSWIEKP